MQIIIFFNKNHTLEKVDGLLEYLRIEAFLSNITIDYDFLKDFLKKEIITQFDVDYFFKKMPNFEFFYICEIIQKNFKDISRIQKSIYEDYFYNLSEKNSEHLVIINAVKKLNILIKNNDNLKGFSYCLSVWFVLSFSALNLASAEFDEGRVWINRYTIIYKVADIYRNFTIRLEVIFNETDIKVYLKSEFKDVKILIWVLLHICVNNNILKKKTTVSSGQKKNNDSKTKKGFYKTSTFVSLLTSLDYLSNTNNLEIFESPMKLQKIKNSYYIMNKHYTHIKPLVHKNKLSKKTSTIGDLTFIKLRSHMKLFIRWNLFYFLKKMLFKVYNIDEKITEEGASTLLSKAKKNFWIKKVQREFSRIFSLSYFLKLERLENFLKNGFYFQYYFDFRGRLYADSPISYTNNLIFRYIYYYGEYTLEELKSFEYSLKYESFEHFNKILKKTNLKEQYPTLDVYNKVVKFYIQTVFFEIGKIFKNLIINEHVGAITYENFIDLGIEVFKKNQIDAEKLDDQIAYWSLIYIIRDLADGKFLKIPIFKDATASGPQILSLVLGVNSEDTFKKNNLITYNTWYDTYYFIIKDFLEECEVPLDFKEKFFTRKILKKTIMTYNYNATYLKCWDYFKEEAGLPWDDKDEQNIKIEIFFRKFFNYLKKTFESNSYYNNPSSALTDFILNWFEKQDEFYFCTEDNFWVFLKYYIIEKNCRIDRTIKTEIETRETLLLDEISDKPDMKKTLRSLQANLIHALDAYLIRKISLELGYPVITIHDSIGVDILSIQKLEEVSMYVVQHLYDLDPFDLNKKSMVYLKVRSNMIFL